jgi:hypothetical protein
MGVKGSSKTNGFHDNTGNPVFIEGPFIRLYRGYFYRFVRIVWAQNMS